MVSRRKAKKMAVLKGQPLFFTDDIALSDVIRKTTSD